MFHGRWVRGAKARRFCDGGCSESTLGRETMSRGPEVRAGRLEAENKVARNRMGPKQTWAPVLPLTLAGYCLLPHPHFLDVEIKGKRG